MFNNIVHCEFEYKCSYQVYYKEALMLNQADDIILVAQGKRYRTNFVFVPM